MKTLFIILLFWSLIGPFLAIQIPKINHKFILTNWGAFLTFIVIGPLFQLIIVGGIIFMKVIFGKNASSILGNFIKDISRQKEGKRVCSCNAKSKNNCIQ